MKIPNLPTDNLYKFLALFGLVLIVFSSYTYSTTIERAYLFEDNLNVKKQLHKLDSLKAQPMDSLKIERSKIELNKDFKEYRRIIKRIKPISNLFLFLFFLGFGLSFLGFYKWYYKTQKLNDEILIDQANRIKSNQSIFIHKIQFEKEFEIYNELWKNLIELRNYTSLLRPQLDFINLKESDEEKKNRLEKFNLAFKRCINTFENNKPFYPKDVYDEIEKTIQLARKEVIEYNRGEKCTKEYWENTEKNIAEIVNSTDIVCDKIRERIGLIKIEN